MNTYTVLAASFMPLTATFMVSSCNYNHDTVSFDTGVAALKFPMRFQNRIHEFHNSMDGEAIAVTKSRIIPAEFTGAIQRDEPFTLHIEGKFTKEYGTIIPFIINQKYEITWDNGTETWVDFVSCC
jgi:hypothetical protein